MARKAKKQRIQNQETPKPHDPPVKVTNGFADAIGFGQPFGSNAGFPGGFTGQQVEDTTTLFENLRWYMVSNMRQLLSQLFVEIGLVQTICCVPVQDGLRGGVMFKSKQLDEDEIKELSLVMKRESDLDTAGWAAVWNRLYGGAGILILTEDQDPEEPLDIKAITKDTKVEFRAVDMWELFWDKQNTEGYDPQIQSQEFEFYDYYAENVHKTRVMRMKGIMAPSFIRPRLRGWGVSVVEALVRSMNQYLKATDLGFEVLDEFKLDVYKIKNMVNTLLSPNGTAKIKERVHLANWQKNFQNALVMDTEDEFDHKQLSFAGLAEAMQGIRMQVAADMRMPIIKLFGQSVSSGLGNSAQDEMENYNSMVESEVRGKLEFHILQMAQIRCQQLHGFIPDDLELEFKPLRELTAVDQENVKTQKFQRILQAQTAGLLSDLEYRDACNKGNLFDIQLDTNASMLSPDDPDVADSEEGADDSESDLDMEEPGADREESRAPEISSDQRPQQPPKTVKNFITKLKNFINSEWDESEHPRARDGKFGSGGGNGGSEAVGKKPETEEFSAAGEITQSQKDAVEYYKRVGYAKVNGFLRGNKVQDMSEQKAIIGQLDAAINSSRLNKDTTVYRGMYNVPDLNRLGEGAVGQEISMPTYWSTSVDAKTAKQFSMEASQKGKNAFFEIRLKAGQRALDATQGTAEPEVLLPRGQKYKVVGFKKGKTPTYILEVEDKIENSAAFDKASYEADGGKDWIHPGREEIFRNPMNVDGGLWSKAKAASKAALGQEEWQFVVWWYKKQGGKF